MKKTDIAKIESSIMIIGGPDSGKTTFTFQLAGQMLAKGIKPYVIDSDIGQSSIGPPACIGGAYIEKTEDVHTASELFFIGDITPVRYLMQVAAGAQILKALSSKYKPHKLIVDTSGLISKPFGIILKYHKTLLLDAKTIIYFERADELQALIQPLTNLGIKLIRKEVSPKVTKTSPKQREARRKQKYQEYFQGSASLNIPAKNLSFYPRKRDFSEEDYSRLVGLTGLYGHTLGVGIIEGYSNKDKMLKIFTPYKNKAKIRGISLGTLKITKAGEEIGRSFV